MNLIKKSKKSGQKSCSTLPSDEPEKSNKKRRKYDEGL
jgi:hypothetical protein